MHTDPPRSWGYMPASLMLENKWQDLQGPQEPIMGLRWLYSSPFPPGTVPLPSCTGTLTPSTWH